MGLEMTLPKECNHLGYTFDNAYWAISELGYDPKNCLFRLSAYPSREAKLSDLTPLTPRILPIGSSSYPVIKGALYLWEAVIPTVDIFPDGIPLDEDSQKTEIYNFIKAYTNLPFVDVLEEEE